MADEPTNEAGLTITRSMFDELEEVREKDKDGILHPQAVEEFARDPQTALHGQFEWDDKKASLQYRLHQARQVIRAQVVMLPQVQRNVRAYVSVPTDRDAGGGYRRTESAVNMPNLRVQLAVEALNVTQGLKRRYAHLPELALLWAEIDAAVEKHRMALGAAVSAA